uniref:DUF4502 domain-containing protein n=1 Tax=Panthera tigris altaica TaxID=74533 RepID=A0A8C9JT28_PANTA
QRKRNWDIEYPSLPGGSPLKFRRAGLRTVGATASLSEAWLRCGEGFQDTSGTLLLTAEKKIVTENHLELSLRPKEETAASKSTSGLTDITWSSSGSDDSFLVYVFCELDYDMSCCGLAFVEFSGNSLCLLDLDVCVLPQIKELFSCNLLR